ncbi:shikimate dehydrogenase [Gordonia insulae]|uniref:Shikimate dehydrogenase (NADP(+)) n=1 Tax=Gordonia insulae TaxID=2420509 RepID=A0A3G8JU72_9ACTN|nr:shikimate dehydrogenase [Gordonia insulae]AZG48426.1 Quinate/shikimate dehydrogenase (NAD(+)) [Gordonia insulae]
MFHSEFATAASRIHEGATVCALVGQGISHSLTPPMHEREAAAHGLHHSYLVLDVPPADAPTFDLGAVLDRAQAIGMRGLNVTHPFKQRVLDLLDELSPGAERLGAVNTVVFDDGRRIGHNTDWSGFARNFDLGFGDESPDPVSRSAVVQLGAGGAGAAVAYAMLTRGVGRFHIVDADPVRARALAESLRPLFVDTTVTAGGVDDADTLIARADGLVHATPIGMAAHPGMAVSAGTLRADLWVAEVVYRPVVTELIANARSVGARTLTGDGMAVHQAVDALHLFHGIEPDAARMTRHIRDLIAAEDAAVPRSA